MDDDTECVVLNGSGRRFAGKLLNGKSMASVLDEAAESQPKLTRSVSLEVAQFGVIARSC